MNISNSVLIALREIEDEQSLLLQPDEFIPREKLQKIIQDAIDREMAGLAIQLVPGLNRLSLAVQGFLRYHGDDKGMLEIAVLTDNLNKLVSK